MGARSPVLNAFGDDFSWSLLDAAPDGIIIASGAGEIVFANDQASDVLGYPLTELVGLSVDALLPDDLKAVHRAHRTRYRAQPMPRAMGAGLLLRARRADGTEFPVEISLSPLRLGDDVFVVAGLRDVSDRVAAEDHMHRVLRTLDATDDGVFIFDADTLRYSYVNEGAVRLVGYTADELLTMTPLHLNPNATEAEYRDLVRSLEQGTGQQMARQANLIRSDGVDVPVEKIFQLAASERGGPRWVIVLARNITARLAAEAELRRSQEALREAEQVLAVADDRERIARDLHDTVIQRLFGTGLHLQAIAAGADERTQARILGAIDQLDETIKELRMAIFSLQTAGAAPAGLRGRLLDVITDAGPSLGVEPRLQFDGPIESIEEHVAEHLIPTLREALSNIAHHARARNVRVTISVNDLITLTVIDDGVGVPDEVIGGRGLGNMASRADKLGGTFDITNLASGGAELVWSVPVDRVSTRTSR